MNPAPFSLRELLWMARGRWRHTSAIMATLCNVNRDPKKGKPLEADAFNPYARKPVTVDRMDSKRAVDIFANLIGARGAVNPAPR